MITQNEFFDKYRITKEGFEKTKLNWAELEKIHDDHVGRSGELLINANLVSERLRQIKDVHSLKLRIKDPEHLIEKIIRKKEKNPSRTIDLKSYRTSITDLIGVRALHLFKDDWVGIHKEISSTWAFLEKPTAYVREGDLIAGFKENGCKVAIHEAGYRSVHYLIKFRPFKEPFIAEIQVRTIFEEGWSEIDHKLRYPYDLDNQILSEYLATFNRYAGSADEMGTFIKRLKIELAAHREALKKHEEDMKKRIEDLEEVKKKLKDETTERKKLQGVIDSLSRERGPSAEGLNINDPRSSSPSALGIGPGFLIENICQVCHKPYPPSASGLALGRCSDCDDSSITNMFKKRCLTCGKRFDPTRTVGLTLTGECNDCYNKSTRARFGRL